MLEMVEHSAQSIAAQLPYLNPSQQDMVLLIFVIRAAAEGLLERAAENGWRYEHVETLRQSLTTGLVQLLDDPASAAGQAELDRFARQYEQESVRQRGPFGGCQACHAICFYRAEVQRLLIPADIGRVQRTLVEHVNQPALQRYTAVSQELITIVQQWLGEPAFVLRDIAYCVGLHVIHTLGLHLDEEFTLATEIAAHLVE